MRLRVGPGLSSTTADERAWLDYDEIITDRVAPNRLALERLNAERASRGLRPT